MNDITKQIWDSKYVFFGTFFIVFTLTYIFFTAVDFLPEPPTEASNVQSEVSTDEPEALIEDTTETTVEAVNEASNDVDAASTSEQVDEVAVFPVSIAIKKLDKVIPILNPTSRTIADLDAALLDGVVRHPDSATLSQDGNVFILGHSSYLPNVFNKNFQAFNGIQNLEWGDIIEVFSDDMVFEYRVEKVYRVKAQDITVPIAGSKKRLTLATCNSFGSVDDRYIVEAEQVAVRSLQDT